MRRMLVILPVVVALGCSSSKPKEATDQELAFQDQSPDGKPIAGRPVPRVASGNEKEQHSTTPAADSRPGPDAAPAAVRAQYEQSSATPSSGPVMTILYITSLGSRNAERPAAVIFSSDRDSPYLQERPRPTRILKPLDPADMQNVLDQLKKAGLDQLPAEVQLVNEPITGEHQIIMFRDGKRTRYAKSNCQRDANTAKTFVACEQILVARSQSDEGFYETQGLHPQTVKPANKK